MLAGIGNDITECKRIQNAVEARGKAFLDHFLTLREQAESGGRISYYAGRWAAKEALSKALGCGIGEHCAFTDIEIINNPAGKPEAVLSGKAELTARSLNVTAIHLSISHEKQYAVATVVLEKN